MNKDKWFLQDQAGDTSAGGGGADTTAGAGGADTAKGASGADATKGAGGQDTTSGGSGGDVQRWPSDWRQRLASDNPDALKTLERFTEPQLLWKSYEALRQKMASGELKAHTPFPDKGTPEEQTAWRKEQGIPEKADAYDLTLANGVVIGDEDKPLVGEFLKFAHANHTPVGQVKKTLEWFLGDYREQIEEKRATAEAEALRAAEDTLRTDWGVEYRPNMNAIQGLLDAHVAAESGLKERILKSIRLEPEFAKLWANLARQLNPMSTLTGSGGATEKSIVEEWKGIQKLRTEKRADYNKDEKLQARERDLISAMQRMGLMDSNGNLLK